MPEFEPAWDVVSASQAIDPGPWLRLIVGFVMVSLAIAGIVFRDRLKGRLADASRSAYLLLFIGLLWTAFHAYFLFESGTERESLVNSYMGNEYESVEGNVQVLHKQPHNGHDRGDIVKIGDQEFEINYYRKTAAYRITLAHGGLLKDGITARVSYIDDQIVAIEIAR